MTTTHPDGPGFLVGAEVFLDLGKKVDRIHDRMARFNPVYKPVGGSITVPNPAPASITLDINTYPSRGRTWNILKVVLASVTPVGPDVHTPLLQAVTTPAVPASGTAQYNSNAQAVAVTVTGGTVTVIAVNGTATGQTSGTVIVPAFGTITLTYSAAPTWAWAGTTLTVVADVYAGSVPDLSGPTIDNAILGGVSVPSVNNITKHVDWCSSGQHVFATLFGIQQGQQIIMAARVAEYPVEAVEALQV
jgi:hypothetical protein